MKDMLWSRTLSVAAISVIGALSGNAATAQVRTAVEYEARGPGYWDYDSTFFVTWFPEEIAALDAQAGFGVWLRSGREFNVWSEPASGAVPTCRFYSPVSAESVATGARLTGVHFYTSYPEECAALRADRYWRYEGIAFYVQLPDQNGMCAEGTTALYRLYNANWKNEPAGGWHVHHYTTSVDALMRLMAAGWISEGNSTTFASACLPQSSVSRNPKSVSQFVDHAP